MSAVGRSIGVLPVAALSARLALRSKLVPAVLLLCVGSVVLHALTAVGDGSPLGRMQAYLSWTVDFAVFVLSLTAVFLSTTLAGSIKDGRLVPLCAAPVRREAIVVGWWLGTVSVLGVLAALSFLAIWIGARVMVAAAPPDQAPAMEKLLVAHGVARPEPPDEAAISNRVVQLYTERAQSGRLPPGATRDEVLDQLRDMVRTNLRTVPRGKSLIWTLSGIETGGGTEPLTLRFRYQVQAGEELALEQYPLVRGRLSLGPPRQPIYDLEDSWPGAQVSRVLFPPDALQGGETLQVAYTNTDRRPILVVFPERGVEVLYPSGGFGTNVARAALVLLGRLLFLIAVGVAAASLIDRRLAAGVALWFLVIGAGAGFLEASLSPGTFGALDAPIQGLLRGVLVVLPDLNRESLSALLAGAEAVSDEALLRSLAQDGLLRGGLALVLGAVLFARRELGAQRS